MMVGDCGDFVKLVAITKKRKALDLPPADFIVGKKGEDDGADLDDDTQVRAMQAAIRAALTLTDELFPFPDLLVPQRSQGRDRQVHQGRREDSRGRQEDDQGRERLRRVHGEFAPAALSSISRTRV